MGRSVVVAGSGVTALAAAPAAVEAGAEVTVLECHPRVGGSTALGGGIAWNPAFVKTALGKAHAIDGDD